MKITKYGHSCLLINEGSANILIDPGAFSAGFENLSTVNALLITHQHPDHLVLEHIKAILAKNPEAKLYADEDSSKIMGEAGIQAEAVKGGDHFEVKGVTVQVFGEKHAVIHPDIPDITDAGYLIAGRLFDPGDAYTVPNVPVEILAAPVGAPWLKVEESINYVRAVRPKIVIPIHDGVLSPEGMAIQSGALKNLGGAGRLAVIENGHSLDV